MVASRPVKLPGKSTLLGECRVQWPDVATGKGVADAVVQSPMTVHFIRAECEIAPRQLISGFKRQVARAAERSTDSGYWFDGLVDAPDGRKRSIDVWIMRASDVSKAAATPAAGGMPGGMPGGMMMSGMTGGMAGGYGGQSGAGNRLQANDGQSTRLIIDVLLVDVKNPVPEAAKAASKTFEKSEESE
jgi:hypothetical protein